MGVLEKVAKLKAREVSKRSEADHAQGQLDHILEELLFFLQQLGLVKGRCGMTPKPAEPLCIRLAEGIRILLG